MIIYLEYRGYSVELPQGETVLGRDIGCALRLNDSGVSRRHLRVLRKGDDVIVEDLGSTNGSFLNGRKVTKRTRLGDRDAIELGGHQLLVRMFDEDGEQRDTFRIRSVEELDERLQQDEFTRSRQHTTQMQRIDPPVDDG